MAQNRMCDEHNDLCFITTYYYQTVDTLVLCGGVNPRFSVYQTIKKGKQ